MSNTTKIALIPYWLREDPFRLPMSDHAWWFDALAEFTTHVYAGPYVANTAKITNGKRLICIKTDSLFFGIDEIAEQLLNYGIRVCDIDILWHVLESSATCRLNGVGEIGGPRVAVIADTHHLNRPISGLIEAIRKESYTHITCTHNQHSPFFEVACDLPSFSFPFLDYTAQHKLVPKRTAKGLVYYGNLLSLHHKNRSILINTLLMQSIPISLAPRLQFDRWISSLSTLNAFVFTCSLNGSFSFQTLMPLLSGNRLLTDPIAKANWLGLRLEQLDSCYIYKSTDECLEIARHVACDSKDCYSRPLTQDQGCIAALMNSSQQLHSAFSSSDIAAEQLVDLTTPGQRKLRRVLEVVKKEGGYRGLMDLIHLFETTQELHRAEWSISASVTKPYDRMSELRNIFIEILPSLLPRLSLSRLG